MQKITQQHVLQNGQSIKAQQAQQLEQYSQNQIAEPTQQYLHETVAQHLQGLTPNFTEVCHILQVYMHAYEMCCVSYINLHCRLVTHTCSISGFRTMGRLSQGRCMCCCWPSKMACEAQKSQLTSFICARWTNSC